MKRNYEENLHQTIINANSKALTHAHSKVRGAAHAWDNVKGKNSKRYSPRGKAFKRLVQLERDAHFNRLQNLRDEAINLLVK